MRAVVFDQTLRVEQRENPRPADNEALIRVDLVGICNTDLELTRGYMGFSGIPGHEFVGTVEQAAEATWRGARVVGEINVGCGSCGDCARGLSRHCAARSVLGIAGRDGAMAELLCLPVGNLHHVPDQLSDQVAIFTEPLAAACEIAEQVHLRPGGRALVIGDGKLGLLVVQVLVASGCRVSLCGNSELKLQLGADFGAEIHRPTELPSERFDLVVEASGSPSGLATAISMTRPRGTLVLKSTYAGGVEVDLAPLVIDEISLVGSRCGRFAPALALLQRGVVDVSALLTAVLPLDQAVEAFALAQQPESLKVALRP